MLRYLSSNTSHLAQIIMFRFLKREKAPTPEVAPGTSPVEDILRPTAPPGVSPVDDILRPQTPPSIAEPSPDSSKEEAKPAVVNKESNDIAPAEIDTPEADIIETDTPDTTSLLSKEVEEAKTTPEAPKEAPEKVAPLDDTANQSTQTTETKLETPKTNKKSLFSALRERLSKTRRSLTEGLGDLILGKKSIDEDLLEELETRLLMADVGIEATTQIIDTLTKQVSRKELANAEALFESLHQQMHEMLQPCEQELDTEQASPFVILVVGINGAGKTTTIGKLAKHYQSEGKRVMLAAGDTFRAAAVEQLQTWGERNDVPVVAQATGADSASVIYDAVESAKAKNIDIIIADTAGRLHTQDHLMDELHKIKRVIGKVDAQAPHEVMLVVDASFGQNALNQAQQFHESIGLTGITLTKLDGTAKGGILFAIANKLQLPFRYIGVGEEVSTTYVPLMLKTLLTLYSIKSATTNLE